MNTVISQNLAVDLGTWTPSICSAIVARHMCCGSKSHGLYIARRIITDTYATTSRIRHAPKACQCQIFDLMAVGLVSRTLFLGSHQADTKVYLSRWHSIPDQGTRFWDMCESALYDVLER